MENTNDWNETEEPEDEVILDAIAGAEEEEVAVETVKDVKPHADAVAKARNINDLRAKRK